MTNKERWLSAVALLLSILPFILLAGLMQLLPPKVELPNLLNAEQAVRLSKYEYLYLSFLGIIPLALAIIARILRIKGVVGRNFAVMTLSALCLSAVFLLTCLYVMLYQIVHYKIDLIKSFDFFGGAAVIFSLFGGMLSNFLPRLRPNDVLGIKNRYTLKSNRVWAKVHYVAADVYMITFFSFAVFCAALGIFLDFRYGGIHLGLWALTVVGLLVWGNLYSRAVYTRLVR